MGKFLKMSSNFSLNLLDVDISRPLPPPSQIDICVAELLRASVVEQHCYKHPPGRTQSCSLFCISE